MRRIGPAAVATVLAAALAGVVPAGAVPAAGEAASAQKPAGPVPPAPPAPSDKPAGPLPEGYQLLYAQDFKDPSALGDFVFSDPAMWQLSKQADRLVLDYAGVTGQSTRRMACAYKPKVRSPHIIGLVAGRKVGDFVLEADVYQNGQDYGHRDACLFFGFTDPSKFYYVHIAKAADPNAHNVFLVHDAPRTNIARRTTRGAEWGAGWHRVRLERRLADGSIKVYFDDPKTPIMEAEDKTFGWGWVGFGSFDDSGFVANIRLWGPEAKDEKAAFFPGK